MISHLAYYEGFLRPDIFRPLTIFVYRCPEGQIVVNLFTTLRDSLGVRMVVGTLLEKC